MQPYARYVEADAICLYRSRCFVLFRQSRFVLCETALPDWYPVQLAVHLLNWTAVRTERSAATAAAVLLLLFTCREQ